MIFGETQKKELAIDEAKTLQEISDLVKGLEKGDPLYERGREKWNVFSRGAIRNVERFDEAKRIFSISSPETFSQILERMLDLPRNSHQIKTEVYPYIINGHDEVLKEKMFKKWIEIIKYELEEAKDSYVISAPGEEEEIYLEIIFSTFENAPFVFFEKEIEYIEKIFWDLEKDEEFKLRFFSYFIPKKLKFSQLILSFINEIKWTFVSVKRIREIQKAPEGFKIAGYIHPSTFEDLRQKLFSLLRHDEDTERYATLILSWYRTQTSLSNNTKKMIQEPKGDFNEFDD
jgi:hypothetical protein